VQHAQSDLAIDDLSICFENMAKFRKFLISINYDGLIAASTDNTKLEEKLRYSTSLGAILGSTLPLQETSVSSYNEIDTIVKKIQTNNIIAKYVCVYILQVLVPKVPLFVLEIILNNSENISDLEFTDELYSYICDYFEGNVNDLNSNLKIWPTDNEIRVLINDTYKEANALAKCIFMVVTLNSELLLLSLTNFLTSDEIILLIEENLTKEFQDREKVLTEIVEMIGNVASLNLRNDIDKDLIYAPYTLKKMIQSQFQERDHYNSSGINPSIASKM
ncbi:12944_t:CDS:2, partial [Funneliformis mosseae]